MSPRALRRGVVRRSLLVFAILLLVSAGTALAQPTPPDCAGVDAVGSPCRDGRPGGIEAAEGSFLPLNADEVRSLAVTASVLIDDPKITVAVVDRAGRVLAIVRNPAADPANDELAVGVARTSAFFSHNTAPLSSRTVRFISSLHFPPGVKKAYENALYGIENTNRGCDFNLQFNAGKCIPRATSVTRSGPCSGFDNSGCGPGIVTGKPQPFDLHEDGKHPEPIGLQGPFNPGGLPVNAGGIPLYRIGSFEILKGSLAEGNAKVEVEGPSYMVGAIGVAGVSSDHAEFAAFGAAALGVPGVLFPAPSFPELPRPGRVIIDGIRLPFVDQGFRPKGTKQAAAASGTFIVGPNPGGCVANRYLSGPIGSPQLSRDEVDAIIRRSVAFAQRTRGYIRLPLNSYSRMVIAVSDLNGNVLGLYRMPDSTIFSIDVAVAKARNVVYFSGAGNADLPGVPAGTAVNARTLGYAGSPLFPGGIDFTDPGPFFDLFLSDLANACSQGSQQPNANQSGIVFFPGSTPLYRNGVLVGGLGISGDGVDQDDYVTLNGAAEFYPDPSIWADRVKIDGVRLPYLHLPRQPEGVTEKFIEPFDEP